MSTGADRSISGFGFREHTPIPMLTPPTQGQQLIERQSLRELTRQREEELSRLRSAEENHRRDLEDQRAFLEQAFREEQQENMRKAQAELQNLSTSVRAPSAGRIRTEHRTELLRAPIAAARTRTVRTELAWTELLRCRTSKIHPCMETQRPTFKRSPDLWDLALVDEIITECIN